MGVPPMYVRRRTRGPGWMMLTVTWALVFAAVWTLMNLGRSGGLRDPNARPRPIDPRGDLLSVERTTIETFRKAAPSVVYITSIEYRQSLFTFDVMKIPRGTGSGFVWDRQGHIVTNMHVILDSNAVNVTLADHTTWSAEVVGAERDKDLAVLKIDAPPEKLHPLPIGSSSDLMVGQMVLAIGNPFGFDHTLTVGVVSALGREIQSLSGRPIRDVIQTDAAINPGNSGGPLLDSAGRLIGVNTQIASPSGTSAGIGFAVPVDIVNRVVPQLIAYGRVIRPALGVLTAPDQVNRQWELPGVLILDVVEGGAAARAGLRGTLIRRDGVVVQLGDVIVGLDDHRIRSQNDLLDALEQHEVGDRVTLTYVRDGEEQHAEVVLQAPG